MLLVNGLNNSPGYWKRQYSIALMQRNTDSSISSIFLPGWTCKKCCIRNRRFLETRRTHPSSSLISSRGSHTWLSVITCFSSFAPETLHGRKYIQCYKKLEEYTIWWTALTYIVWEFPLAHPYVEPDISNWLSESVDWTQCWYASWGDEHGVSE